MWISSLWFIPACSLVSQAWWTDQHPFLYTFCTRCLQNELKVLIQDNGTYFFSCFHHFGRSLMTARLTFKGKCMAKPILRIISSVITSNCINAISIISWRVALSGFSSDQSIEVSYQDVDAESIFNDVHPLGYRHRLWRKRYYFVLCGHAVHFIVVSLTFNSAGFDADIKQISDESVNIHIESLGSLSASAMFETMLYQKVFFHFTKDFCNKSSTKSSCYQQYCWQF